jgi:hypothetical protein
LEGPDFGSWLTAPLAARQNRRCWLFNRLLKKSL